MRSKEYRLPPFSFLLMRVFLRVVSCALPPFSFLLMRVLFVSFPHPQKNPHQKKRKGGQRTGHYKQPSRVLVVAPLFEKICPPHGTGLFFCMRVVSFPLKQYQEYFKNIGYWLMKIFLVLLRDTKRVRFF